MLEWIQGHWKFIIATITPVAVAIQAAITDSEITNQEWSVIIGSAIVALGVFAKANTGPEA